MPMLMIALANILTAVALIYGAIMAFAPMSTVEDIARYKHNFRTFLIILIAALLLDLGGIIGHVFQLLLRAS